MRRKFFFFAKSIAWSSSFDPYPFAWYSLWTTRSSSNMTKPPSAVLIVKRRLIVGMINLLFTISTAEGGFVILLEDLVVHKEYQAKGYGSKLLDHAIDFAKKKNFLRITLLTDRPENVAQEFFRRHGFVESTMIPMRLWVTPQQNSD